MFLGGVVVHEAFNKRNQGTRVWRTANHMVIYVLEGRLQLEHWEERNGLAYLNVFKPVLRVDKGELVNIEPKTVFRMTGITYVKYLMLSNSDIRSGLMTLKVGDETNPTPVPPGADR
jgi:hypothetical protein